MSEEELRGVCTTADALIEFCNKQVGAARADAGDPRDVLLCNLLTDYLEKRVARARTLLKAIQRGERPAAGRARTTTYSGLPQTGLPTPSRPPPLNGVLPGRVESTEQVNYSFASSVAGPSVVRQTVLDADEDDYWGPSDDGFLDIEDPIPPAVPTPATPPASQRGSRAVSVTRETASSGLPPANPPVAEPRDLKEKPYYPKVKEALTNVFKLQSFRALQLRAVCTAMDGGDVFVLFPTGSGKSLTFQLPAVCQDGLTVVVSPLKSLIMDQQRALKQLGIDVEVLLGDMPEADKSRVWQRLRNSTPPKLMYLTPEMLQMSGTMENALTRLRNSGQLKRFVIDEAHLITDWGLTFRDSYAHLSQLRIVYPDVPISALTGTANAQVQRDIISRLRLRVKEPFKLSFNRPNLDYDVRLKKKNVLEDIATFIRQHHPRDTGIIYCSSRDRCEEIAKSLREKHNLNARHYHAQMVDQDKTRVQYDWSSGHVQIIVATIAFGMGIDKADVRYVIHHDMPSCLNGYYQETGRAGRDGKYAHCILYYNMNDYHTWVNRIRKDQTLTPELRSWQEEDTRRVLNYCTNNVQCRRKQVLSFFDEGFNAELCRKMCDNCRDDSPRLTEDHTQDAQQALRLFENLTRGGSKYLTAKQLALALKGNKPQTMVSKGFTSDPLYGIGAKLRPEVIDRLIEEMQNTGILTTQIKTMASGYSQTYLLVGIRPIGTHCMALTTSSQLGPKANALKAGREKVVVSFRMTTGAKKPRARAEQDAQMDNDPAPISAGPSAIVSVQSAAQVARVSRKAPTPARQVPKPKEPEISLYRDDSDDDPEFIEDEIEDISSPPPARRMGTRGMPSASQRMADGWDSEIEEVDPPPYRVTMIEKEDVVGVDVEEDLGVPERCHQELRTLRDKMRIWRKFSSPPHSSSSR
ncbi:ATP-dependent DNA helicase [Cubamyces sp. BRFM 1775]|nr:ATP-dependent DNA helicase [Cubamyces sp. BRFM 1775]